MNDQIIAAESTHVETRWMTAGEIAFRLRLHRKTILRLARAGVVPCLRAGHAIRFDPVAVEAALCRATGGR